MAQIDVVFSSVPFTATGSPLPAPGILKNIAIKAGLSSKAYDMNWEWQKKITNHQYGNKIVDFLANETYYPEIENFLLDMFTQISNKILADNPKHVGLSVFTYANQIGAKYLAMFMKQKAPNVEVFVGGQGIYNVVGLGDESNFLKLMRRQKLIDRFFTGDAEGDLFDWLKQIGGHEEIELSFDDNLFINFDDYAKDYNTLPLVGSRGCVRKCKFCSDIVRWQKYKFRTADSIFTEMLHYVEKYDVRRFSFVDPLINGNMVEFRKLLKLLVKYNTDNKQKITYSGSIIFRPKNQFKADDWSMMNDSGADQLFTGIESFDEQVRHHMGKKFNDTDLRWNLEQCLKHNIQVSGTLIVGYPTETEDSIKRSKIWLKENTKYQKILKLSFGGTMMITPGTWLDLHKHELGVENTGHPYWKWTCTKNGSTPAKRVAWLRELRTYANDLGWNVNNDQIENEAILDRIVAPDKATQ